MNTEDVVKIKNVWKLALLLSLLAALILPGAALAASGSGNGVLRAWGRGEGAVQGDGSITVTGNGNLWVRDDAGDVRIYIKGEGVREDLPSGWIHYYGFDGSATISGSDVTVGISGDHIRIYARGAGRFALRGQGSDRTSGDGWSLDVTLLDEIPAAAAVQP